MKRIYQTLFGLTLVTALLPACQQAAPHTAPRVELAPTLTPSSSSVATAPSLTPALQPSQSSPGAQSVSPVFSVTYHQLDGNHVVGGAGGLPDAAPLTITLAGTPRWVVSAPLAEGSAWVAVLDDGQVQGFEVAGDTVTPFTLSPATLPPEMPPLLRVQNGDAAIITSPIDDASLLTHPVPLSDGRLAVISDDGQLVVTDEDAEIARLDVSALPDARILRDERDRLLLLTDATTVYQHGAVGDQIEAGGITLIDTQPEVRVALRIILPQGHVVEGIAPIWADFDGDGNREIIVTQSDARQGAQIVAYSEQGEQVAAGPAIGSGNRWRHQIALAPFGPERQLELVDVLTPHLGRTIEFFRWTGDSLTLAATLQGYTSHAYGSRNLDTAAAGDFDDDGVVELLLVDPSFTQLVGVAHTASGAVAEWTIDPGAEITTNLGAVTLPGGDMLIGVGTSSAELRIWSP